MTTDEAYLAFDILKKLQVITNIRTGTIEQLHFLWAVCDNSDYWYGLLRKEL